MLVNKNWDSNVHNFSHGSREKSHFISVRNKKRVLRCANSNFRDMIQFENLSMCPLHGTSVMCVIRVCANFIKKNFKNLLHICSNAIFMNALNGSNWKVSWNGLDISFCKIDLFEGLTYCKSPIETQLKIYTDKRPAAEICFEEDSKINKKR